MGFSQTVRNMNVRNILFIKVLGYENNLEPNNYTTISHAAKFSRGSGDEPK